MELNGINKNISHNLRFIHDSSKIDSSNFIPLSSASVRKNYIDDRSRIEIKIILFKYTCCGVTVRGMIIKLKLMDSDRSS